MRKFNVGDECWYRDNLYTIMRVFNYNPNTKRRHYKNMRYILNKYTSHNYYEIVLNIGPASYTPLIVRSDKLIKL